MAGKLATVGLAPEEITLLTSMVAIIAIRTKKKWELVDGNSADVFLVNTDSPKGNVFVMQYGDRVKIIRYSQKASAANIFNIQKPLRARDLLSALEGYSDAMAPASPFTWLKRLA